MEDKVIKCLHLCFQVFGIFDAIRLYLLKILIYNFHFNSHFLFMQKWEFFFEKWEFFKKEFSLLLS